MKPASFGALPQAAAEVLSDDECDRAGWKLLLDHQLIVTEPFVRIGNYIANDVPICLLMLGAR